VAAGDLSSPAAAEYLVRTLMERRRLIVDEAFSRVTPLEVVGVAGGEIVLRDLAPASPPAERRFEVEIEDGRGRRLDSKPVVTTTDGEVRIASDHLPGGRSSSAYVRIVVRAVERGGDERPMEIHVRLAANGAPYVVGILR